MEVEENQGGLTMTTCETLRTIHHPLYAVTPVLWRCGELCGINRVEITTPWGVERIGGAV